MAVRTEVRRRQINTQRIATYNLAEDLRKVSKQLVRQRIVIVQLDMVRIDAEL